MSSVYFDTEKEKHFGHDAQMISLMLMVSRLFLFIQYDAIMVAVYYRRPDKSLMKPFEYSMCTSLAATFWFLCLSFSKSSEKQSYGNLSW
jgi:hypothetical protein